MKSYVNLWYIAKCFLEQEMFETKFVEKMKINILCSINFFPKILPFFR
jgi:hypothetical protein